MLSSDTGSPEWWVGIFVLISLICLSAVNPLGGALGRVVFSFRDGFVLFALCCWLRVIWCSFRCGYQEDHRR